MDTFSRMIRLVTDLADQAVILPAIVLIAIWLALAEPRRTVVAWVLCCGLVLGTIGLLKLGLSCTPMIHMLRSPSGHTASAVLVAGGLLVLLAGPGQWRRAAAVTAGIALGATIGATRVWLRVHTVPEVIVGAMVGAVGLILFARSDLPRPRLPPMTLIAAFLMLAFALHGTRLRAEQWITAMSCLPR